jgi:hypothetical protein
VTAANGSSWEFGFEWENDAMRNPYALLVLLLCLQAAPAAAQVGGSYDLSWNVIPGGSGTMTGGDFSLSGSGGQPATAVSAGGSFAVAGGFWTFPTPIPGDVNGDGQVDVVDLLWLVDAFGSYSGDANWLGACDFNGDGAVDVVDLLDMVFNFGYSAF